MEKANPINVELIDHVVVRVNDLEAMVAFYTEVLGCKLERGPGEIRLAQLRAGRSLIDLVDASGSLGRRFASPPDHGAPNMDHFCLQIVPWDRALILEHLEAHGVVAGDVESRYGADGQGPSIYIQDPEGNTVELKGPGR